MYSYDEAVELAKASCVPWHDKQPEFKGVTVYWDKKSPKPFARRLEDGVSCQVLLVHNHFLPPDGPLTAGTFTYTVKDDPATAQCDCKPSSSE